jgi:hypothetical protein
MKLWDLLACLLVGSLSFSSYSFILSLSLSLIMLQKEWRFLYPWVFQSPTSTLFVLLLLDCLCCFYWIVCVASIGLFVNYPASSASCNSMKKRGEEGKEEK